MTFKQHKPITTLLASPFTLSKVPVALRALKLNPETYYGADVCDANGTIVAELE